MAEGNVVRPAPASSKFTYEDLQYFPDDGRRREIIDGELYVTPSPSMKHQMVSMNLSRILSNYLTQHRAGLIFAAPLDTVLSDFDVVEPDLLYVSRERLELLTEKNVKGAPDLVIEILSPSTRRTDEMIKRRLYERFRVHEYWVVDPELDAIKIYRVAGEAFVRVAELSVENGDTLTTPLLPEFAVSLADVFRSPI
jgi:Uma2 family endonuclease